MPATIAHVSRSAHAEVSRAGPAETRLPGANQSLSTECHTRVGRSAQAVIIVTKRWAEMWCSDGQPALSFRRRVLSRRRLNTSGMDLYIQIAVLWFCGSESMSTSEAAMLYPSEYFPTSIVRCAIRWRNSIVLNGSYFASRRRMASCVRNISPSATAAMMRLAAPSIFSMAWVR